MSLPMSCYQDLLERVRSINAETKQLHAQINSPLPTPAYKQTCFDNDRRLLNNNYQTTNLTNSAMMQSSANNDSSTSTIDNWRDDKLGTQSTNKPEFVMWNSVGPTSRPSLSSSFKSDEGAVLTSRSYSEQQLGVKVDMVYGLMSMLESNNKDEMTKTLLSMSHSPDSCVAMRQSGCVPLLVQLIHSEEEDCTTEIRQRAVQALHNLVNCQVDDKQGRREVRVLRLLEKIRNYSETMCEATQHTEEEEISQVLATLMKLSFDEDHRHAMCQLGALYALSKIIQIDTEFHGTNNKYCIVLRRYAGMTLTNLTFGHGSNKTTLCCLPNFIKALVMQLSTPSEHLRQVTASVLRNLSWRADAKSKQMLREVGTVSALMIAAMEATKESTLKSILSALWNFSAHCNNNKIDICNVDGALPYLISRMKSTGDNTLTIIENAGGVMRNISSHIAMKENYRVILREHQCLQLLLDQLRSPSLTVVSNSCGTLWNLSARCTEDQMALWSLGAVPMLKSLIHSRHKMISMGASAALKNLLAAKPDCDLVDKGNRGMPSLLIRKRRALEKELDANLAETCDNIENSDLPSPITPQSTPSSVFTSHHSQMMSSTSSTSSSHHQQHQFKSSSTPSSINQHHPSDSNIIASETDNGIIVSKRSGTEEDEMNIHNVSREDNNCDSNNRLIDNTTDKKTPIQQQSSDRCGGEQEQQNNISFSRMEESYNLDDVHDTINEPINELDQPTNYSLRYSEKEKNTLVTSSNFNDDVTEEDDNDDCVKAYCTEDTPYNFSTSTSLSDLRIIDAGEMSACKTPEDSKPSSGRGSPQKYGGPGTATFDETPLMFSRCSSLGSLSSCEQHDQGDQGDERSSVAPEDRYSVVSDFSRMTSGMISPSDIPDSPLMTAPVSPSPRGTSSNLKFTYPPPSQNTPKVNRPMMMNQTRSVFEDNVTTYKDEEEDEMKSDNGIKDTINQGSNAPLPPSSATDETRCYAVEESPFNLTAWSSLSDLTINTNTSVSAKQGEEDDHDGRHERNDRPQKVEDDMLNDEDILQQCIMVGMESAKTLTLKKKNVEKTPKRDISAERDPHSDGDANDEDILAKCIQLGMTNSNVSKSNTENKPKESKLSAKQDSSALSLSQVAPGAGIKLDLSDEEILQQCIMEGMSSYCQTTDEHVLQQCIKAGMEKFKQVQQNKNNNSNTTSSSNTSNNTNNNVVKKMNNINTNTSNENFRNFENKVVELNKRLSGMNINDNRNTQGGTTTTHTEDFDLDQWANNVNEQDSTMLLEQCIEAGIPYKSKNVSDPSVINQQIAIQENIITTATTGGRSNMANQKNNELKVNKEQTSNDSKEVAAKDETDSKKETTKQLNEQNTRTEQMNESTNKLKKSVECSNEPSNVSTERLPNEIINKKLTNIILTDSMKDSWKLDDNLNDDLVEGLITSSNAATLMTSTNLNDDVMKDSLSNNTWSEDITYPTVSLSPPACLKTKFDYDKDKIKHVGSDKMIKHDDKNHSLIKDKTSNSVENVNTSPMRKSIAKVTPFPETAKIVNTTATTNVDVNAKNSDEDMKYKSNTASNNIINDLLKYNSNSPKHNLTEPNILTSTSDDNNTNFKGSLIDLDYGKLGIMSSIDFEDLNSIKPPSMIDSMDKSIYNNNRNLIITSMTSSVNIDSIKPPSYFDEIEDLESSICNIDSIVSEVADTDDITTIEDDITLVEDEQHRVDNECKLERKITPKQKRNLSKERYNTFTINKPESTKKLTPKQRRQQDRDRYATRTIHDDDNTIVNHDTFVVGDDGDSSTLMSGNISEIEDFEADDEEILPYDGPINTTVNETPKEKTSKLQKPKTLNLNYKSNIPVSNVPESKSNTNSASSSGRSSIPSFKTMMPQIQPLQRQGTFTKDEPTTPVSNIPILSFSCQTTPKKSMTSLPTQIQYKSASSLNNGSIKYRNNSQPNIKRNITSGGSSGGSNVRNSYSNTNLKNELSKTSKLNNSTPSLNRRSYIETTNSGVGMSIQRKSNSNSNSSLNSIKSTNSSNTSSTFRSTGTVQNKTVTNKTSTLANKTSTVTNNNQKQVTSKIANLWKKVEDSKKQSGVVNVKKDNRIWITGDGK